MIHREDQILHITPVEITYRNLIGFVLTTTVVVFEVLYAPALASIQLKQVFLGEVFVSLQADTVNLSLTGALESEFQHGFLR